MPLLTIGTGQIRNYNRPKWAGFGGGPIGTTSTSLGPAGTSASGKQGRKKSLGLVALGNTAGFDAKSVAKGVLGKDAQTRSGMIDRMASENAPGKQADFVPPGRKRVIPVPYGTPAGIGRAVGMGGTKPPLPVVFNKKNPNQREIRR